MTPIKILYVEDEVNLGKIVKESLESRSFEVKMIADGALVMDAFHEFGPDIVLLDIMLPHIDGLTLGRSIREVDNHVPILFLTAKTQTKDVIEGFSSGGNDYIRKPYSVEELIVRIHNLLSLSGRQDIHTDGQSEIALGSLYRFNPREYQLHTPTTTYNLSHRENELLKLLLQYNDQTINRKEILVKIWGDDTYFNSRTLDVYIRKLRTYFSEDENMQIYTIKGVGYRVRLS